jgi:hypothetical protein
MSGKIHKFSKMSSTQDESTTSNEGMDSYMSELAKQEV